MRKTKPVFLILFLLLSLAGNAQNNFDQKLFESLHGHASFNVVFTIVGIILAGLLIFLWRIDRKVSRLEKEMNERKS